MKSTIIATVVSLIIIWGAFAMSNKPPETIKQEVPAKNNVEIIDGKQVVKIRAKGGYNPRRSIAKAGLPTVIEFDSKGTFDCSASVRIPSLNLSQSLDFSGSTTIDVGTPGPGLMRGSCSMGMYPFEIDFK